MKQGNTLPTLIVGILAMGLAIYMIFSFWDSMTDTFTTAVVYELTVSEGIDGKGVIIREEYLLPNTTGLLDVFRTEGEQVGVGQEVGRVYQNLSAMEVQNHLERLQSEGEILEFALGEDRDLITVTRMDEEIVSSMSTLRSSVTTGNFNKLEDQIANLKGNVLRRDYIFGAAQVVKDLEDRYSQVVFELQNSTQNTSGSVTAVTTPVSGAYSILVDGLESLDYDQAMNLSFADLQGILNVNLQYSDVGVGKIITGDTWYFVTSLASEWVEDMYEGSRVTVRFSGDFAQDISMKVERIGSPEDGVHVMVLSSNRFLEQTTLLRIQTAELVYASYTGLRVPKEALRMEEYVNQETGNVTQTYGVYVLSAGYAEFKPVTLYREEKDFYLVRAGTSGANALRQGNIVIVNALGLYDGKLLVY